MADNVALVTGAASGIGRATAQRLSADGATVALADLNEPEAARVAQAIRAAGGQAIAISLDVTSEPAWVAAMARVLGEWGRLDICVNCAGITFAKPITELALADWRRVLTTNLDGVFLSTKHALRAMSGGGGGCIINIASAAGIKALSGDADVGTDGDVAHRGCAGGWAGCSPQDPGREAGVCRTGGNRGGGLVSRQRRSTTDNRH